VLSRFVNHNLSGLMIQCQPRVQTWTEYSRGQGTPCSGTRQENAERHRAKRKKYKMQNDVRESSVLRILRARSRVSEANQLH
jgi:hypothetical protein